MCWLSKGCISGTAEVIKLELSGHDEVDVQVTKGQYVHAATNIATTTSTRTAASTRTDNSTRIKGIKGKISGNAMG